MRKFSRRLGDKVNGISLPAHGGSGEFMRACPAGNPPFCEFQFRRPPLASTRIFL